MNDHFPRPHYWWLEPHVLSIPVKPSRLKSLFLQWVNYLSLVHREAKLVACRQEMFKRRLICTNIFFYQHLFMFGLFFLTWLKGNVFSSEHFLLFSLWSYYLNRKKLLLLFDIIKYAYRYFSQTFGSRGKSESQIWQKARLRWEAESWQHRSFNFLWRYRSAAGVYPANLRLFHLALLLTSAKNAEANLRFPQNVCIVQVCWSVASLFYLNNPVHVMPTQHKLFTWTSSFSFNSKWWFI